MALWEIEAREAVRDTLHRYSQHGDRGESSGLAAQFTLDGVLESKDGGAHRGRTAIASFLASLRIADAGVLGGEADAPLVRHHISNILFLEMSPEKAVVSSYFLRLHRNWPEHWGRYRDVLVPVDDRWLIEHRFVSVDGQMRGNSLSPGEQLFEISDSTASSNQ